jgi:hypothetical protein
MSICEICYEREIESHSHHLQSPRRHRSLTHSRSRQLPPSIRPPCLLSEQRAAAASDRILPMLCFLKAYSEKGLSGWGKHIKHGHCCPASKFRRDKTMPFSLGNGHFYHCLMDSPQQFGNFLSCFWGSASTHTAQIFPREC